MDEALHRRAMVLDEEARQLDVHGDAEGARAKRVAAALLEENAVASTTDAELRSRGILAVSAVSLWFQADHAVIARDLIERYVPLVAPGFQQELRELETSIRQGREARA